MILSLFLADIQKHILLEDFDESFLGLDESEISEHEISLQHLIKSAHKNNGPTVEESAINVFNQQQMQSVSNDYDFNGKVNTFSILFFVKIRKC